MCVCVCVCVYIYICMYVYLKSKPDSYWNLEHPVARATGFIYGQWHTQLRQAASLSTSWLFAEPPATINLLEESPFQNNIYQIN